VLGITEEELIKRNKNVIAKMEKETDKDKDSKASTPAAKGKNFSNVKSTLIVFTASWADNCYFTHPMWVRFSNRFTTDKVRILEIDCTGGAAFNKMVKAFKINT
jgi:hypothetical protein